MDRNHDEKIGKILEALKDAFIEKIEYERNSCESERLIGEKQEIYKFDLDF